MKKLIYFLFVLAVALPGLTYAQDAEKAKRPDNIGISDFDVFKNSSFDIQDESAKLKADATKLDTDIKAYSATIAGATLEKLKADYSAVKGIAKSSQDITAKIGDLDTQGKNLLASAKSVNPRTKSPVATSNTNKSVKSLDGSKKNLEAVATLVSTNTKLLADELKKRGETVDEE